MNNKPQITIITINYNDKVGLQRTFDSVFGQKFQNFEYIVIDGGSEDGSKGLIEENQDKIDYWISEPDKGVYNAMNKGILKSEGQYLLFLNSGDELFDHNVLMENIGSVHTEDLIYFDILQVFKDSTNVHKFPSTIDYNTFLNGTIGHPTTFINRKLFDQIGLYDENLNIVADWKFFSHAVINFKCSLKKVEKTLSKFYMDGISTTNTEETNAERMFVLENEFSHYLRLNKLEKLILELKKSRAIKILMKIGFLKSMNKI
jgi:glycosyltransferase involved in cell wall biosynthesis